jgi:hypothetical protein
LLAVRIRGVLAIALASTTSASRTSWLVIAPNTLSTRRAGSCKLRHDERIDRFAPVFTHQRGDARLEDRRDFDEHRRRDAIGSTFVFLDLLEAYPQAVRHLRLTEIEHPAPDAHTGADGDIDRLWP